MFFIVILLTFNFFFKVIPVIFFFSCFIQMLYYIGVMQWVVMKFGWGLQCIMGTTICESLNSVSNTFIGMVISFVETSWKMLRWCYLIFLYFFLQTESLLLIKPYVSKLTSSEIHAVMCSGFASVSGISYVYKYNEKRKKKKNETRIVFLSKN